MKIGILSILLSVTCVIAGPKKAGSSKPSPAAPEKAKTELLDTASVRKYYLEGDFDPAIDLIETSLRYKTGFNHEDSVFMFKHLGVMYAAKYETREKGKHYMHRLLEVEPTARILDMYASDMIYMIFKNIQDEFDAARDRLNRAENNLVQKDSRPLPKEDGRKVAESNREDKSSTALWIGASAAVVVAAGAATYFYFSDEPETVLHDPN